MTTAAPEAPVDTDPRAQLRGLTASLRELQAHTVTVSRRRGALLLQQLDDGVPAAVLADDLGMTRQSVHKLATQARKDAQAAPPA